MPAAYTRRDLIDQTLDNLGVLATGATPAAEDVAKIDKLIDPTFADLQVRSVTYVNDPGRRGPSGGSIEPELFLHLARVLADEAKAGWGLAGDPSFYVLREQAEEKLRVIGRPAQTRRTLRTDPMLRRGARW